MVPSETQKEEQRGVPIAPIAAAIDQSRWREGGTVARVGVSGWVE